MTLSITILCYYAQCSYDECHVLFTIMLNVIMLKCRYAEYSNALFETVAAAYFMKQCHEIA
jgi:hypothetical protein